VYTRAAGRYSRLPEGAGSRGSGESVMPLLDKDVVSIYCRVMTVSTNTTGKLFAVGDIHGCHDKLVRLLDRLPFVPSTDAIVFLGDYLNRGPKSRQVLERLMDVERQCPRAVFLLGNHERALLEYARTGEQVLLQTLRSWGVEATLQSYGQDSPRALRDLSFLPESHVGFLERLRLFHRERGYLFVHAGVMPGQQPESSRPDALLDIRDLFLRQPSGLGEVVVFGHTSFETPLVMPDKIGIDTGAVYGNALTAVELAVDPAAPRCALRFHHA